MERRALEGGGTDDDCPRPQFIRDPVGGRFAGNSRSFPTPAPHQTMQRDMEFEIHELERAAYCDVLRAFKAQSDALTWVFGNIVYFLCSGIFLILMLTWFGCFMILIYQEKEGLITELRKELRVSDDEHRELLTEVNADDLIHVIREWREGDGHQNVAAIVPRHANNQVISPAVSGSLKRPRTSLSRNSFGTPSQSFHRHPVAATTQPLSSTMRQGPTSGTGARRPNVGRHSLVYDNNTQNATVEWVNINEVPHEDKDSGVIEIFHTGALIKKVEKLLDASNPSGLEFEKAKKLLKEHEQTLIQVIAKLAETCDSDGEHPFMHGHSSGRRHKASYLGTGSELEIAGRGGSYELANGVKRQ